MSRDSATVSNNMRKIHSKDTSIELLLRKALWHKGYRYRKNYKALPGSPDIVLTKYKIAIFCDSEFFHGKDWEILKLRLEKGKNPDFWIKKIERNRNRDYENDKKLLFLGYTVLHFWVSVPPACQPGRRSLHQTRALQCDRVVFSAPGSPSGSNNVDHDRPGRPNRPRYPSQDRCR